MRSVHPSRLENVPASSRRSGLGRVTSQGPRVVGILSVWAVLCVLELPRPAKAALLYPTQALEAIFLYRFTGYVTWPSAALATPTFTIAVAGDDAVADELSRFLPTHPVASHPAQVKRVMGPGEVGDAQMLYIGTDYPGDASAFIRALAGRPVLVVTDRSGGLSAGSMINFVLIDQHVRFEVSLPAAERVGLKISAQLLRVASHVSTGWLGPAPDCRPSLLLSAAACSAIAAL